MKTTELFVSDLDLALSADCNINSAQEEKCDPAPVGHNSKNGNEKNINPGLDIRA
jgi:hypothetical protein